MLASLDAIRCRPTSHATSRRAATVVTGASTRTALAHRSADVIHSGISVHVPLGKRQTRKCSLARVRRPAFAVSDWPNSG
jgi:hypothetical protein